MYYIKGIARSNILAMEVPDIRWLYRRLVEEKQRENEAIEKNAKHV